MDSYILLSEKKWHDELFVNLKKDYREQADWVLINNREDFTIDKLTELNPKKIFIPHWSYIIDKAIYEKYECVVFHMTDLPFGRGGSPLQNLIVRGLRETKISAIRVNSGIDTGDIYLKEALSLEGTAREIFERATPTIQRMIKKIIDDNVEPKPQVGEPVIFKRRKPEDSNLSFLQELEQVYDYVRMLDCEGYPNAYIETVNFKFHFSDAQLNKEQNVINANVRISKK
jgi:methionyl-tRNA formyltransferase